MEKLSYLSNAEINTLDALYQQYKSDPQSVDYGWQKFFEGFEFGYEGQSGANGLSAVDSDKVYKEINVLNLIAGYRSRGHLFAKTNPILPERVFTPTLAIENFNLHEADLNTVFNAGSELGIGPATLRQIIDHLELTYCRTIGVEYKYVSVPERVKWLQERMESTKNIPQFSLEEKRHILRKVGKATTFENFLHRKFVGQKRFSLEGAEAIIPALDATIETGAALGVQEFVIGMAHRGRLNVLTNILQKEYDAVFSEFSGRGLADDIFDGDVKYHMGFSSDPVLRNGKTVHLSLVPNPSHLEAVNPVVIGVSRAKMDNIYGKDNSKICPILIHGDASLAGQGVVYELIQMYKLEGYEVGGTVHIVINNQIGFTTDSIDSRSSTYCTDVGRVTRSPVFHVNGDDIEAVVYVTQLAMEYRQTFKQDVFVDIVCYRKYGHNEGDEPRYTQPLMYAAIEKKQSPFKVYLQKLLSEGALQENMVKEMEKELDDYLNKELEESKVNTNAIEANPKRLWDGIRFYDDHQLEPNPDTRVSKESIFTVTEKITAKPEAITLHRNIEKLLVDRRNMVEKHDQIDWGMAEHLAFGTLLLEGRSVRLSGQDVERGTFTHRHAVLRDMQTNAKYYPLNNISPTQAPFTVHNSHLSEFAVLGFEFGYSMAYPKSLTIWEAQFGDFSNGAQIIIDQFISASKTKWQRLCGVTLLLPHGYEGQGPEHSSARLERYLQLGAENNMYVCNFTTPANFFHALRRQVHNITRRPLIVFTPKSLLRHPRCVSAVADFTERGFMEVIDDHVNKVDKIKKILFCSGKVYYDLLASKEQNNKEEIAIVRIEQLYPFPLQQLQAILSKYKKAKQFVWVQEEPENMGAWSFMLRKFRDVNLEVVARKESASPATGSHSQHLAQQQAIINRALDIVGEKELAVTVAG